MNQLITFAEKNNIQVDQLHIDRFWSSLYDDKWVYVDSEIIRWIGYDDEHIREGKNYILRKLRTMFTELEHFKLIKLEDVDECDVIPSIDFDTIHSSKLLIVEPDAFKELLLSMNTTKTRQVQKYYIQVEKLCRKFMHAQLNMNTPQIARLPLEPNECVYVISNNSNAKMHLYKIGRTKNLKSRLSSLNTSNPDRVNNRLRAFTIIKTFDSKSLEEMIHAHLDAYRHSKEWFQIEYKQLIRVIEHFKVVSAETIELINSLGSPDDLPEIVELESKLIEPMVAQPKIVKLESKLIEPMVALELIMTQPKPINHICPNCNKAYKFANALFQAHIKFCK